MAKPAVNYACTDCGYTAGRWFGKCPRCNEFGTLVEELVGGATPTPQSRPLLRLVDVKADEAARIPTGVPEFDRVLGGGLVPASLVLVGGEPGVGKSTLLLTALAEMSKDRRVLLVTGEESAAQVKLRAERLHGSAENVSLLNETLLETILATAGSQKLDAIVVDSIQTVFTSDLEGAPGNVGQVRECAARLMRFAKETETTVFAVGHVTKGGGIAGPKTLEHIVDTVLYFEGEGMLEHRILRATKNRFGSVDEIGVFRMTQEGLIAVENPSELFLGDRLNNSSGSAVTALLEGSRPVLIEIQGLAAKAGFGTPQRVSTGYDGRRLALLLAVLDKRAGLSFSQLDVFLNVVGGVRMQEPAGDLAVASALASSIYDRPVANSSIFLGEVGLGGEIRPVSQAERRLGEAAKMGMTTAYMAERGIPKRGPRGIEIVGVRTINDLFRQLFHA